MIQSSIAHVSQDAIAAEQQRFMVKVYNWMTVGLAMTGGMAFYIANTETLMQWLVQHTGVLIVLLLAQLGMVVYLSGWVQGMSASLATGVFTLYAGLNGVTFSFIFLAYTSTSIASTFFVTAGTFGAMSLYGYVTKKDLSGWGSFLFMGLVGLVLASMVNLFLHNETLTWITTYAGVLIFVGLTAYDTQKIKTMNILGNEGTEEDHKEAIIGALTLYLDFINLFLSLLRIMGERR
jgi:hypothetical protein